MLFSDFYNIKIEGDENWFDPILNLDTRLFIDPILIKETQNTIFKNSYDQILEFFSHAYKVAAASSGVKTDMQYRLLKNQLVFPEVQELCLGYSDESIDGAGSGKGFAQKILDSIFLSIRLGIDDPSNFERISIFNKGIAEDRISDISANIIKADLIIYTQDICKKLGIPMQNFHIKQYSYNIENRRWENISVQLPKNPFFERRGVIFVPKEFIGLGPHINPKDFIEYCFEHKGNELRDEFSYAIQSSLRKDEIIEIAKSHTDWVLEYEEYKVSQDLESYDISKDHMQIYNPIKAVIDFLRENSLKKVIKDKSSLANLIEASIKNCLIFLDLYTNKTNFSIRDQALQSILKLALTTYMHENKIKLANSNNIGKKTILFESENGIRLQFNFKIKSAKNTRFWNKLRKDKKIEENTYFIITDSYEVDFKKAYAIDRIIRSIEPQNNAVIKYVFDSYINGDKKDIFRTTILSKRIDNVKILDLISQDKIIEVLEIIGSQFDYKEITNLKAQLKKSKSDYLNGLKTLEDHNVEKSRIRLALLEMIN